uniref:Uncharacterized protein n=1 Tax=Pyrodinium bahamense TaxID=73915 RepID=A0A7S0FCC0_9DINO
MATNLTGEHSVLASDEGDDLESVDAANGEAFASTVSSLRSPPRWRFAAALSLSSAFVLAATVFAMHRSQQASATVEGIQSKAVSCHTAVPDEMCHDKVTWAMVSGIRKHPENYKGLTPSSSFEEFQAYFHNSNYGDCPMPCMPAGSLEPPTPAQAGGLLPGHARAGGLLPHSAAEAPKPACLCLFDVDRTLTGKQGALAQCPGNKVIPGVTDTAFSGGPLTLSALGQAVSSTFCGACLLGVVSAGGASGPAEMAILQAHLPGVPTWWSGPGVVTSPLVRGCGNNVKHICASGIRAWYEQHRHVKIPPSEVYFFDDLTGNTKNFAVMGFNARQVSCNSREGDIGLCGALPSEIVRMRGIFNCR